MIIDFIIEDLMLNSYLQKNFHTLGLAGAAILETIRKSCDRWLPAVLRMVYNSGGFLVSV